MRNKLLSGLISLSLITLLYACSTGYYPIKSNRNLYSISAQIPVDSGILNIYKPYKLTMDKEMSTVVAVSTNALTKRSGLLETNLGNFFADACLQQAKLLVPEIDFALPSTVGGMRTDLPAGNITRSNIFELMPFENQLVVIEIKGNDVLEMVKYILNTGAHPVSGIRIRYKDKQPTSITINGVALQLDKTYKLLTSDYIVGGGDGVKGLNNIISQVPVELKVREALEKYVQQETAAGRSLNFKLDGRIKQDE